jgi:hypothetical protein
MVTPQQLQITIDCDDEEVIRRLKLAIESDSSTTEVTSEFHPAQA